jgi:hypothetical protein
VAPCATWPWWYVYLIAPTSRLAAVIDLEAAIVDATERRMVMPLCGVVFVGAVAAGAADGHRLREGGLHEAAPEPAAAPPEPPPPPPPPGRPPGARRR